MLNEDKGAPVLKIQCATYDECKQKLFEKYGNDYSIIDRKQIIKGGFLGFGQKTMVEVTYNIKQRLDIPRSVSSVEAYRQSGTATWQKNREELLKAAGSASLSAVQVAALDKKVDELKNALTQKLDTITAVGTEKHPSIQKIENLLEENEFTFKYITAISDRLRKNFSLEQLDDFNLIQTAVVDWIGKSVFVTPHKAYRPPHVIVVVGPTGVGKTTTIAKIAANLIMDAKKTGKPRPEMRIITIDRTRVGAVEQLARYGELMSIPVDKAESAEDVRTIYEDCKKVTDAVLIDTSGYSPNDSTHIGQMRAMLDVDGLNPDVYLAISASTKATDLNFIIQNYEPFAFGSIIVTKCDETKKFGNILSVLEEKHKSISYITDGQRVPHNIMKADVVYFLTRLSGFQIDRVHIDDEFGAD
ncbi:MAG: flagellar biosynthesis protein FlhF [Treponema sp.]|jgi:flagellar biosynthesis protein FlhF|nr:flagellar biosynthesis protein FlhF [Treponema sp.]